MPDTNPSEMPIPLGISADTGLPLDPIEPEMLKKIPSDLTSGLVREDLQARAGGPGTSYGTIGEVDMQQLDQAGWGVIFAPQTDPKIREALQPLLDHRAAEVGDDRLFKIFEGTTGFNPGDDAAIWLKRLGVRMDVVDPLLGVPFYLMIVAPPDVIPFEFQYALDLYWGVGRLWFETADEFRQYAQSVIQYETMSQVPTSRQIAVFAPRHDFDNATKTLVREVANPMVEKTETTVPIGTRQKFVVQPFIGETGEKATKNSLNRILTGAVDHGPPAVLFSGGHGKSFRADDPRQAGSQGALITQDWASYGPVPRDAYFDASDVPSNAKVHGLVHFLFACYGGGWPEKDTYSRFDADHKTLASRPAMARLPRALLAHPEGGALAVVAHIDRAWTYSFHGAGGPQTQGFRDVLGRVMRGDRLGQATDQFNMRWAVLSNDLAEMQFRKPGEMDPQVLANQWIARDDARNYVVYGDPAVRVRVEAMPALA
jgi:hypothetical protein